MAFGGIPLAALRLFAALFAPGLFAFPLGLALMLLVLPLRLLPRFLRLLFALLCSMLWRGRHCLRVAMRARGIDAP